MDLLLFKALSMVLTLLVTGVGICIPYLITRSSNGKPSPAFAVAHSLVGGVFVGAALLHLLPDAIENCGTAQALALVLCGLMFADVCETITVPHSSQYVASAAAAAISRKGTTDFVYVPEQTYRVDSQGANLGSSDVCHDRHQVCPQRSMSFTMSRAEVPCFTEPLLNEGDEAHGFGDGPASNIHHHHIHVGPGFLSWVIAFMLSIHSVVTGAALGFAGNLHNAMILAVVIVAHKGVEAFAVSFNFAEEKPSCATTSAVLAYSFMTPIGVIVAVTASELISGTVAVKVEGVIEAFATGNFLYVGMLHLQDKTGCRHGWFRRKILPEMIGAGLMWAVSLWI